MSEPHTIINETSATHIIRGICGDECHIDFIRHGQHNLIAKIDESYVYRFPRDKTSLNRFKFEITLLETLNGTLHVHTPKVLRKSFDPAYAMLSLIPGEQFENKDLRAMSDADQKLIGQQLAGFSVGLNKIISPEKIKDIYEQSGAEKTFEPWAVYLERIFEKKQSNAELQALIDEYYIAWKHITERDKPTITVHDDLHPGNLLFLHNQLHGILDFEHANAGTIEQEFRLLYRIGGSVIEHAAAAYQQLTGYEVDMEAVRVWAIINELAAFVDRHDSERASQGRYLQAQAKLRYLLPDFPL